MHRQRLFIGAKHREQAEERLEPRASAGQGGINRPPCTFAVAGQRKHERIGSHRPRLTPRQQWCERFGGAFDILGNSKAEGQPAPCFVGLRTEHRYAIVRLRLGLLAEQVERQPAIERN